MQHLQSNHLEVKPINGNVQSKQPKRHAPLPSLPSDFEIDRPAHGINILVHGQSMPELQSGTVIRTVIAFPHTLKIKFFVIAGKQDNKYLGFLINSHVHNYLQKHEYLARCQIGIDANSHKFLEHDSFIACHEVFLLNGARVEKEVLKDNSKIKGFLNNNVLMEIINIVKKTKTITPFDKTHICENLIQRIGSQASIDKNPITYQMDNENDIAFSM